MFDPTDPTSAPDDLGALDSDQLAARIAIMERRAASLQMEHDAQTGKLAPPIPANMPKPVGLAQGATFDSRILDQLFKQKKPFDQVMAQPYQEDPNSKEYKIDGAFQRINQGLTKADAKGSAATVSLLGGMGPIWAALNGATAETPGDVATSALGAFGVPALDKIKKLQSEGKGVNTMLGMLKGLGLYEGLSRSNAALNGREQPPLDPRDSNPLHIPIPFTKTGFNVPSDLVGLGSSALAGGAQGFATAPGKKSSFQLAADKYQAYLQQQRELNEQVAEHDTNIATLSRQQKELRKDLSAAANNHQDLTNNLKTHESDMAAAKSLAASSDQTQFHQDQGAFREQEKALGYQKEDAQKNLQRTQQEVSDYEKQYSADFRRASPPKAAEYSALLGKQADAEKALEEINNKYRDTVIGRLTHASNAPGATVNDLAAVEKHQSLKDSARQALETKRAVEAHINDLDIEKAKAAEAQAALRKQSVGLEKTAPPKPSDTQEQLDRLRRAAVNAATHHVLPTLMGAALGHEYQGAGSLPIMAGGLSGEAMSLMLSTKWGQRLLNSGFSNGSAKAMNAITGLVNRTGKAPSK